MKINNHIVADDFEEKALEALIKKDDASKALTDIEKAIALRVRDVDVDYYEAYLDYMETDNAHMRTFLDYLKVAYDNFKFERFLISEKKNEIEGYAKQVAEAFEKYSEFYEVLKLNENTLRAAIEQLDGVSYSQNPLAYLKFHGVLAECDKIHLSVHTAVENLREQTMPILDKCEELFFDFEDDGAELS